MLRVTVTLSDGTTNVVVVTPGQAAAVAAVATRIPGVRVTVEPA